MRVSDAERAEVADQLAQHYGDGRLDQAELDERLGRAMGAKTQADLTGITADLPHIDPRPGSSRPAAARASSTYPPAPRSRPGRPRSRVLPIVLLIALAVVASHALTPFFWAPFWLGPGLWLGSAWWLWIALLIFCWLRFGPRRRR
jgi:hypothetical protein